MRTLMVILGGLVLLAVFVVIGRAAGGDSMALGRAAVYFIPAWLLLAAINLWVGVKSAGYSVAEEAPIFAIIFLVPAAVAVFLWWKFARA
ncbi:MAG TPA: hypothetical protein VII70_02735 [Steroidobacteraceae bacterium]